jgi:hypothetical protein
MHSQSQQDVPDYCHYGFGMPDGPVLGTRYESLAPAKWSRISVDRPMLLVRDTDAGSIYVRFCGPLNSTVYHTSAIKYLADCYRRGQQGTLLHRPGYWDIYNDHATTTVVCRLIDAASIMWTNPNVRDLNGYDPTIAATRGVGVTSEDPAALWTANRGGATLYPAAVSGYTMAVPATSGGVQIVASGALTKYVVVQNQGEPVMLSFGAAVEAYTSGGYYMASSGLGVAQIDGTTPYRGPIFAISPTGSGKVFVTVGV